MTRILACVVLVFLSPLAGAQAQAVYKCADRSGVTYQQRPCAPDEAVAVLTASGEELAAPLSSASSPSSPSLSSSRETPDCPKANARGPAAWRNSTLCIGITDDEVLNLAGWGRPSAIDRSRERRGWQERWTYAASPDGGALYLRFFNGRLASVEAQ